jgi:hypothetical protein
VKRRSTFWHLVGTALELGLAGLIGVGLIALAWAANVRFDFTPEKIHTLSDQAKRTARRLEGDVQVTVFYNSQEQGRVREMKELLRRFGDENPRIHFRMYDLDRSPRIADEYGIVNYNSAILEGLGRRITVRDLSETELTSQLIRLIEGRERVALFAVGHGELDPGDSDERKGLTRAAKELESENYRIERARDLRSGIPPSVALVVVARPSSDFAPSEIAALRTFLEQGGGVFALLEANAPQSVQAFVSEFGIVPRNDLIVDERNRLFFADSFEPQVAFFNAEILPETNPKPAILPLAQSIDVVQPERPDVQNAPLAFTDSESWSSQDLIGAQAEKPVFRSGVDRQGPLAVAAIAKVARADADLEQDGALVVIGDAEFASNLYVGRVGNLDLFANLAHLASRAEALIGVRKETAQGGTFSRLQLSATEARVLFSAAVVVLPGLVLLFGAFVEWRRRTRSADRTRGEASAANVEDRPFGAHLPLVLAEAAVVVVVAGLVALLVLPRLAPPPPTPPGKPLVALRTADVREVEVTRDQGGRKHLRLDRTESGWDLVTDAGPEPVPPDKVTDFLGALADARVVTEFADDREVREELGIDEPTAEVTLRRVDGEPIRIVVGNRNPTLTGLYVQVFPGGHLSMVGSVLLWEVDKLAALVTAQPPESS